jgi:hypothetical protein
MSNTKSIPTPPTTQDFAAKLAAVSAALATVSPELPTAMGGYYQRNTGIFSIGLSFDLYGWKSVARLIPWAEAYDANLYVSLTSYGSSGQVETSFEIDGVAFSLDERIGTAEAYQLGSVMGRPLNPDKGLSLTPAEMRSALTLIGGA